LELPDHGAGQLDPVYAYASTAQRQRDATRTDAKFERGTSSGQGELFDSWRYHCVFTDGPFALVQSQADHRDHAVIEQTIADLKAGPLAHLI
jgi:hypothetical protein